MTKLDLDALEQDWKTAQAMNMPMKVGMETIEKIVALIQRLREMEADLETERALHAADHLISQQSRARADKAEAEIGALRFDLGDWRRKALKVEARIAQLERVREATEYVLGGNPRQLKGPDILALRAALDAVEEPSRA